MMATVTYILHKGQPFTPDELEEIETLKNMKDEEIDYSDIPKLTEEKLREFRRVNPKRKAAN